MTNQEILLALNLPESVTSRTPTTLKLLFDTFEPMLDSPHTVVMVWNSPPWCLLREFEEQLIKNRVTLQNLKEQINKITL